MSNHPAIEPLAGTMLDERRRLLVLTAAVGGVGLAAVAVPFASSFQPSERARAAGASVEVDLADLAPGALKVVAWRGKPVWVMRRTPEMLAALAGHGSTFDLAGRVYKNKPAPINLEVPPHSYLSDSRLLIGEDAGT